MRRIVGLAIVLVISITIMTTIAHPQKAVGSDDLFAADIVGMAMSHEQVAKLDSADYLTSIDYGAFVWVVFPASARATYPNATNYQLELGERRIDTSQPYSSARGIGSDTADFQLIQFIAPPKEEWLAQLKQAGVEIVQYIHPFSYIVWGTAEQIGRIDQTTSYTRWHAPFDSTFRALPSRRAIAEAEPHRIVAYRRADSDLLTKQLSALTQRPISWKMLDATLMVAEATLDATQVANIAELAGIYTIQLIPQDGGARGELGNQIAAFNYTVGTMPQPTYAQWLNSVGVDGTGVVVAAIDQGFQDSHPELADRVLPCHGETCIPSTDSDHGTHTAGIIAGTGVLNTLDSLGFNEGLGVAPGAQLVEGIYLNTYMKPNGLLTIIADAAHNGATLSNNSWGTSSTPLGYDLDTRQLDLGVRDADADVAGNQSHTFVLAFNNGFGSISSQGTPDEAKNSFTIGSTRVQNNLMGIEQFESLSSNTGYGPARDGRVIPHLVAPGCYIYSTARNNQHRLMCGTSMAAPHVTGGIALFIEQYRQKLGVDPSPALIKATFSADATSLAGYKGAKNELLGVPFDSKQGWGRLNLSGILSPTNPVLYFDNPMTLTQTGQEWTQKVVAADPTQPVRVMLVWTDAPGHGLGGTTPAWNNDLDLILVSDGKNYSGNAFGSDGWSLVSETADPANNMEGIFLPALSGQFSLRVRASNLTSDGIPNNAAPIDQDFALVCYNCVILSQTSVTVESDSSVIWPNSVVTYTIQRLFALTETVSITQLITNVIPTGLNVLPNTIQINGILHPLAYDPVANLLTLTITDTSPLIISYQAVMVDDLADGVQLTNTVTIQTISPSETTFESASKVIEVRKLPLGELNGFIISVEADQPNVWPNSALNYNIQRIFSPTQNVSVVQLITNELSAELTVLTETILLNGVLQPLAYDAEAHRLTFVFTDTIPLIISYQAIISGELPNGTPLTNTVTADVSLPQGDQIVSASSVVKVRIPIAWQFLPIIHRE